MLKIATIFVVKSPKNINFSIFHIFVITFSASFLSNFITQSPTFRLNSKKSCIFSQNWRVVVFDFLPNPRPKPVARISSRGCTKKFRGCTKQDNFSMSGTLQAKNWKIFAFLTIFLTKLSKILYFFWWNYKFLQLNIVECG